MPTTFKTLGQAVVGSTRTFNTISNKALTSNVATLTTGAAHSFAVGDVVQVFGVDSTFDGTYVVATVPTSTTFTYMKTTTNVTSAAVSPTGVVIRTHNLGGVLSSNMVTVNGVCTLTTGSAHGFAVNDWVRVTVGNTNMDGAVKVLAVPSSTTFTYQSGSTLASTAITTGAVGRLHSSSWTNLYTVPASTAAIVSTIVVNNPTTSAAQFRIATSSSSSPTFAELVAFDATVPATDCVTLTLGLTMQAARLIQVQANSPEIGFSAYGSEVN
jgi:hypothetical protein